MAGIAREAGATLAFVILLMLGLFALAHGILLASLSEVAGSRAAVRDLQVRAAAERVMWAAMEVAAGPWTDSVALWDSWTSSRATIGRIESEGALQKLGPESWLVRGSGRIGGSARAETAVLAWSFDPLERVIALPAMVTVGPGAPVTIAGTLDGSSPGSVAPPMPVDDCDPWLAALGDLYRGGAVPLVATAPDTLPRLGLLDFEGMMRSAPVRVSGSGTPAPSEALGVCRADEPWGWGDPDQPWRTCGSHISFRAADGDLWVNGGTGQGLLIVDGDLTFAAGARYFGMVIARGALRLEGGATVEGLALAGGGLALASGASLRASACWALRALTAQRERLGRFVLVDAGAPIGPF